MKRKRARRNSPGYFNDFDKQDSKSRKDPKMIDTFPLISLSGCVRLTLFRNKNKPKQRFDSDAIPIPEYMKCIPHILL